MSDDYIVPSDAELDALIARLEQRTVIDNDGRDYGAPDPDCREAAIAISALRKDRDILIEQVASERGL